MLKLLIKCIIKIAKHKGWDYFTICWFADTGYRNITAYSGDIRVCNKIKRGDNHEWEDLITEVQE